MRALSIQQPWAHAILRLGKRIENRDWNGCSYRGPLLLHVGKGVGTHADFDGHVEAVCRIAGLAEPEGFAEVHYRRGEDCGGIWVPDPSLPRGAIVGRARLADVVRTLVGHRVLAGPATSARTWRCLMCGEASAERLIDDACPKADPWAVPGALGIILADVEVLETPVPYKGALGFFEVDDGLLAGARWTPAVRL